MSDDLGMAELVDFAPEVEPAEAEPERDPVRAAWLKRRDRGWGASEISIVLVALGMRSPDILAAYQRPEANPIRIRLSKRSKAVAVPRILLRKAGLRRELAMSEAMRLGLEREPRLVAQWRAMALRGRGGLPVDPASIVYVPDLRLPEILPLTDPVEPRLLCTPDVFARDLFGDLGCVDGKCSFDGYLDRYNAAPEHQRIQVNAQCAVTSATWGAILEGEGWSATYRDHAGEPMGPVRVWPVERDEGLIAELREAARIGWAKVEELRAAKEAMR